MTSKRRDCPECGKTKMMQWNQTTCSMACRKARQARERAIEAPEGECPVCHEVKPLTHRSGEYRCCDNPRCVRNLYTRVWRSTHKQKPFVVREIPELAACEQCGETYSPRRYDQRFCTVKCGDIWRYYNTDRRAKQMARQRAATLRTEVDVQECELCGTSREMLKPPSDFGLRGHGLFQRDHLVARSRGGDDSPSNLRWTCWFCNMTRRHMDQSHDRLIAAAARAFWGAL